MSMNSREALKNKATSRIHRKINRPVTTDGKFKQVTEYFGDLTFNIYTHPNLSDADRKELISVATSNKKLTKQLAESVASAVTQWAVEKGCTHFCHWFQPLTGSTAEKHDAFLDIKNGLPIQRLSASQLMQGEPDASSFPSGGARSTFEARGYTTWDLSSPMFIIEGLNGKTLCVPTAFVSYHGHALDIKTPLLRSANRLNEALTKFCHLIGEKNVSRVVVTCGPEQEYFLVDKAFYYARPDLVMTGRALFGRSTTRNQQLEDHYFGAIPERVKGFMDEFNYELHRLGIPAKTQHNEVAPAQFEIAPIFEEANIAVDHNQLLLATLRRVANRHDLVALLHEKPFPGINGSGKHVNWSMATDTGINLLDPGSEPQANHRFLAVCAMAVEAVYRHGDALRMGISGHSNDHRLGANEAPPSIMSVFLGDTLGRIMDSIAKGTSFTPVANGELDMGATQLARLLRDNTDRNRTSPFAFTGNKFEFRAVGSSQNIGFPTTILNAAMAEVVNDSNEILEKEIKSGKKVDEALTALTKKLILNSQSVIFNGDGYSDEWVKEAEKRGLPNLRTTPEALKIMTDEKRIDFMVKQGIFASDELRMRYNAFIEKYCKCREIEFNTLNDMVLHKVIPAALSYKAQLAEVLIKQKELGLESSFEREIYKRVNMAADSLFAVVNNLTNALDILTHDPQKRAEAMANELLPLSVTVAEHCQEIEGLVPDHFWELPKFYDLLFIR